MLPLHQVQEIRRLLDEGNLSQRKIAKRLNVSRGTVGAIASGQRGIYGRESTRDELDICYELPPERCPGCGAMVYKPCILCRTHDYQQRLKQLRGTFCHASTRCVA